MRVLGVDPGLTRCGVGIVEGTAGRRLEMLHVDVIRTPHDAELGDRLVIIFDVVTHLVRQFKPDVVAVERVFSQHNVRTVMGTAQAAGLAVLAATREGVPVMMHTPSEVKASVTGSGVAGKAQVGTMVTRLLNLTATPKPADAADALALAICHIWRGSAQSRLLAAEAAAKSAARARVDGAGQAARPAVRVPRVGTPA
ncbi:Holliday junction endonuclease RuvC [Frankineae bacterium MT45]|nr:Holliday junction endonuclease RuvC [Frankineae bacterium MT45]